MDMAVASMSVLLIPILLIAVVVFLIFRAMGARFESRQYDERQLQARGNAYRLGFFAMVLVQLLIMFAEGVFDLDMRYVGGSVCLFAGITVFAVYSVWHDAYFVLQQKPRYYLGLCVLVSLCNAAGPLSRWREGTAFSEILHSATCMNLMCGLCFLVLAVTIALKMLRPQDEEE